MIMEIKTKSKEIGEIAQKYGLDLVVLFGSQTRGDSHAHSDIDVAYLARVSLPLMDEARLALDLAPVLGGVIDLVDLKKAPPLLSYNVFQNGQLLYEQISGLFSDFFVRAVRIYQETRPLYALKLALL